MSTDSQKNRGGSKERGTGSVALTHGAKDVVDSILGLLRKAARRLCKDSILGLLRKAARRLCTLGFASRRY
jgi:hypothetical protein